MKTRILTLSLILMMFACDGKLSKEQREALKEEMNDRKIKRISQEDIYKKALEEGRMVLQEVMDGAALDETREKCSCTIALIEDANYDQLSEVEIQLFEAYKFNAKGGDNIQKEGSEILIYTSPVADGETLMGLWFIKFPKSVIVKKL
jgi:hypothetical protein